MYTPNQLRTFTTAHLSAGGWYLDCSLTFTHPQELQLRASLEGKGAIDLEVDEFIGLTDRQRKRAIARREANDKKKEARFTDIVTAKEKKEAERLAKLAEKEKEKEKEKEEKGKGRGKKKVDGSGTIPASSTVDQSSHMQGRSQSGVKRKAEVLELTEDVITHGTQAIVLSKDEAYNTEDLILNISVEDLVDNMKADPPNWYTEVMEFLKKVQKFSFLNVYSCKR
jgi:hypothetical protein